MQTWKRRLSYLIDLGFQGVNRVFVLSFENDGHQASYKKYFLQTVETEDYNIMTDKKKSFLISQ